MQLDFHLQSLVYRRWEELRNWKQFMKDIKDRNSAGEGVDRRKLQKIAEADQKVTLTIGDLRVLQEYFVDLNYVQLQENFMFRAPGSLMDALHGEKAITIFYPSGFLAPASTEGASRYDVRAFEALMRTPEISSLRVSLQDVFHHGTDYSSPSKLEKKDSRGSMVRAGQGAKCIYFDRFTLFLLRDRKTVVPHVRADTF